MCELYRFVRAISRFLCGIVVLVDVIIVTDIIVIASVRNHRHFNQCRNHISISLYFSVSLMRMTSNVNSFKI